MKLLVNNCLIILLEYMDCGSLSKILSVYKYFKNRKMTHGNETWVNNLVCNIDRFRIFT